MSIRNHRKNNKKLPIKFFSTCLYCEGSGKVTNVNHNVFGSETIMGNCWKCGGKGKVSVKPIGKL